MTILLTGDKKEKIPINEGFLRHLTITADSKIQHFLNFYYYYFMLQHTVLHTLKFTLQTDFPAIQRIFFTKIISVK